MYYYQNDFQIAQMTWGLSTSSGTYVERVGTPEMMRRGDGFFLAFEHSRSEREVKEERSESTNRELGPACHRKNASFWSLGPVDWIAFWLSPIFPRPIQRFERLTITKSVVEMQPIQQWQLRVWRDTALTTFNLRSLQLVLASATVTCSIVLWLHNAFASGTR